MRNRTEHGFSWLTAISDAGSTPAASTNYKALIFSDLSFKVKLDAHFCTSFVRCGG
jgi:hypothetical protein